MPLWEDRGQGEVGSQLVDRAGEPQGVWGPGQAVEQGCSPSGLAQGDMQGQAGILQGQVELAVPSWAVDYFPEGIDDPCCRLPTQPKAVDGWGATGEAAEPHFFGRRGGAVARNRTENGSGEGGDAAGGAG